jgi:hypothetical protein
MDLEKKREGERETHHSNSGLRRPVTMSRISSNDGKAQTTIGISAIKANTNQVIHWTGLNIRKYRENILSITCW